MVRATVLDRDGSVRPSTKIETIACNPAGAVDIVKSRGQATSTRVIGSCQGEGGRGGHEIRCPCRRVRYRRVRRERVEPDDERSRDFHVPYMVRAAVIDRY